jgi:hypothetical protein
MAGGGLSRLTQLRRTVQRARDGDVVGAAWQIAKSAVLVKVGLPLLAAAAAVVLLIAVIGAALGGIGNAAAQACGGTQAIEASVDNPDAGPVGAPAPSAEVPIFQGAAVNFHLGPAGPSILAAINEVETNFDTSNAPGVHSGANSAGAEGAMQFEPGTWADYGIVGPGGANPPSPYDEIDAVWSAANYLHASGAPWNWQNALFTYNHAGWYVAEVLRDAAAIFNGTGVPDPSAGADGVPGAVETSQAADACAASEDVSVPTTGGQTATILPGGTATAPADAPQAVKLAIAAGNRLIDKPYRYGGGYSQPLSTLAPDYDCASSTSFVLHGGGVFGLSAEDSSALEHYGQSGPGQWITVYANSGHAFIDVAGIVLDTAWYAPVQPTTPNSGPRWQPASIIPPQVTHDVYGGFVERHPAGL